VVPDEVRCALDESVDDTCMRDEWARTQRRKRSNNNNKKKNNDNVGLEIILNKESL